MNLNVEPEYYDYGPVDNEWDTEMFDEDIATTPDTSQYFDLDANILEETETHIYVRPVNQDRAIWLVKARLIVQRYGNNECSLVMPQWFAKSRGLM